MDILTGEELAAKLTISSEMVRRLTASGQIPHIKVSARITRYNLAAVVDALLVAHHTDDDAVAAFAGEMRKRMAEKRDQGYAGWEGCGADELGLRLLRAITKGNPVDVGNYAMMLEHLGADTTHILDTSLAQVLYEQRSPLVIATAEQLAAAQAVVDAWRSEEGKLSEALQRLAKAFGL